MTDRPVVLTGPPRRPRACNDTVLVPVVQEVVARYRAERERGG